MPPLYPYNEQQQRRGEEPWWSYAGDMDTGDVGKLPAYVYSKLPLPGSETAGAIAGDWQQQEYPRRNTQPGQYVPYTNAERANHLKYAEGRGGDDPGLQEQLGPVIDTAMAAAPFAGTAVNMGRQAGRRLAYDMFESPFSQAGAIRPTVTDRLGSKFTTLEYYKPENPDKTLGQLSYSKAPGKAPYFEYVESETPRGYGELLDAFTKRLGPMLNDLELSDIMPNAVPQWEKIANSRRLDKLNAPDLKQRILDNAARTRAEYGEMVPENSYRSNPLKTGQWIERDMEADPSWNIVDRYYSAWSRAAAAVSPGRRRDIIGSFAEGGIPTPEDLVKHLPGASTQDVELAFEYLTLLRG